MIAVELDVTFLGLSLTGSRNDHHHQLSTVKEPRAKQRGASQKTFDYYCGNDTELFSGLFYVAASRLNSPRHLSKCIETLAIGRVKRRLDGVFDFDEPGSGAG